ncbi:MAG: putative RNA-binding protein with PIN domain [Verrucomicrobiales bacterium]|jgi:predicted RNA-binding protein with PIN domain
MSQRAKQRILLVDGNNVIHAWPELLELHQQRRGLAHTELCRRLTGYQDQSEARVVLVFDGRGDKVEVEAEKSGIQVFYTDSGRTADDVIERLTAKYAGKFEIIVATNDRAEQNAVAALGGEPMSTDWLQAEIERSESAFRSQWGL